MENAETEARENRTLVQVKTQRPGKPQDQAPRDTQGVSLTTRIKRNFPESYVVAPAVGVLNLSGRGGGGQTFIAA